MIPVEDESLLIRERYLASDFKRQIVPKMAKLAWKVIDMAHVFVHS